MCLYYLSIPLDCTKRRTSVVSLAFLNANFYCLSFQVVVAWTDYNVFLAKFRHASEHPII